MYKIYLIRDIHGLKYVGCTKQTLKKRLQNHGSDKRNGKYCSSHKLDFSCCKISILENDITEQNKKKKEQYWIDKIDCVNDINAILDKENKPEKIKQYYQDNKKKLTEYQKKYREENKEKVKQYNKDNKEKIQIQIKQNYQDNKEKILKYKKQLYKYKKSWGIHSDNNLLNINVELFL